jgi:hypothetical protein
MRENGETYKDLEMLLPVDLSASIILLLPGEGSTSGVSTWTDGAATSPILPVVPAEGKKLRVNVTRHVSEGKSSCTSWNLFLALLCSGAAAM